MAMGAVLLPNTVVVRFPQLGEAGEAIGSVDLTISGVCLDSIG
jgi:hypothetical protein